MKMSTVKDMQWQIIEDEEAKHKQGKEYFEELYRIQNTVDKMFLEKSFCTNEGEQMLEFFEVKISLES